VAATSRRCASLGLSSVAESASTRCTHTRTPETGKEREGDISAILDVDIEDEHWHMLDLLVECKNTTAPWIGFHGEKWGNGPWSAASYMDIHCLLCEAMLYRFQELRRSAASVYALTEKRNKNAKDHAYEAVRQVSSALLGKYGEDPWGEDGHPDTSIIHCAWGCPSS
jgi:hypothetical protein